MNRNEINMPVIRFIMDHNIMEKFSEYYDDNVGEDPIPLYQCSVCLWQEPRTDKYWYIWNHVMENHEEYVRNLMTLIGV